MSEVSAIIILLTGFGLGLGHSLDPDHVIAVSTLICNNTNLRKSIASATVWGTGHSMVLFLVGLLVLILRVMIPEGIITIFELAGGVLLVILGILVIKPIIAERVHIYRYHERGSTHSHRPSHLTDLNERSTHLHRSAIAGVLQGLGGSAALMIVTLMTVSSVELGLVFVLIFGAGVILGMISVACLVSSLLTYTASRLEKVHDGIVAVTGSAAIVFGIFLITQIAVKL